MRIGAHIPTSGGYAKMAEYAQQVGCECIQIFAKSPRQWKASAMPLDKRAELQTAREVYDFGPVLTHTSYLINLSTNKPDLYEKSIAALADELVRGAIIEAAGVNTHVGNVPDGDRVAATTRAAQAIDRAFALADDTCACLGITCDTRLILENSAGAGTSFGNTVTELCDVIAASKVPRSRLGICVDTCHAWAFGYDTGSAAGWQEVIDEFTSRKALDLWLFAHANDCKFPRGNHTDRHAWIGEGEIGFAGFRELLKLGVKHPELKDMPVLTEMPGEMPDKDIVNIQALKALRDP